MTLVVLHETGVCGLHIYLCLNVGRFVEQLCSEKRKHAIFFDLHGKLDRGVALVKSLQKVVG